MLFRGAGSAAYTRAFLFAGSAAVTLCIPSFAAAQADATPEQPVDEASPDDSFPADQDASTGNQIVVTATKREQTLQDVPVAVSVTTAETIERAQIRDLRDLQTVVPSLSVGQRQSVANTNFFIRGFGNGANNAGIEPSVGVFVDNVYRSRTAAQITDLPDVQRIEVLRGPQSTLFGKNASAGVISITTEEPKFKFGGVGELTYGNFDQIIARGYVTGPVSDSIAVSVAAGLNQRDGFFQDGGTGDRTNERDRWFARGQLLVDPDNGFRARIIADYDSIDENCCAVVNVQDGLATPVVRALGGQVNAPADAFDGFVYNNYNSTNDIENYGISAQFDFDLNDDFTVTWISAYRETKAVTNQDSDFTSADLIYPNFQDLGIGSFTQEVRLTGEIGDSINVLLGAFYINEDIDQQNQLIYSTQFRPYANTLVQQLSGGALSLPTLEAVFGAADGQNYSGQFLASGQGFTEAYTLDSEAYSFFGQVDFEITDGLVLTLGGNYTDDSKKFVTNAVSTDTFSGIDLDAPQYAPFRGQLLFGGALAQGVGTALGLGRPATAAEIGAFAGSNPAAYGVIQAGATAYAGANANNPLANPLAPLRALQFMPPFLNVPNSVEDGKTNDSDFAYTVRLAYDLNDTINVYASYATGFKASSINLSRDSRPSPNDRDAIIAAGLDLNNLVYGSRFAGPENSRVMEVGAKANWGDISANLAVFDQDISGFQSNIFTGSGFALRNAGELSTFGVEFEGLATIADALTLNLGVTYLDPLYVSFEQSAVGDLSGTRPAGIPTWTVLIGAQYEHEIGSGTIIPRVSFLWQSEEQLIEGLPGFVVRNPDGTIADATPALEAAAPFTREVQDLTASLSYDMDIGLSLTIWARNLLNKRDVGVIFDTPAQPRGISGYANDPRTYGASARYRF
ncbi:TonB-dependent receptor [Altererythrobacter sp. Root672]|uniref:TonB-dependent receptor n=1 Tax=Altererythrobacter sp. Root672 TaxID=1736584 RepID=UPI0006F4FD73|nr:TonB-dependent receptor [Altererythrobacter sp. Root672]KRA84191.1 TonB-dependent receptor [Altererythrobacter sp. Root672]